MFQVATSHEDEISRKESEAEFQIMDKDASAASETPACMKRRPLSRRVQPIPVGGVRLLNSSILPCQKDGSMECKARKYAISFIAFSISALY